MVLIEYLKEEALLDIVALDVVASIVVSNLVSAAATTTTSAALFEHNKMLVVTVRLRHAQTRRERVDRYMALFRTAQNKN